MQEQVFVRALRDLDQPEIYGLVWLSLGIGAPLMEELVFRGLLYRVACRYFNLPAATVLSALFFAVVHNNLLSFLPLFLLGVVFAVAYERYRSLYVPFLMHAIFNTVQFLIMLYVPQVTQ